MTKSIRYCGYCGKPLTGRSDKRWCNRNCAASAWNKAHPEVLAAASRRFYEKLKREQAGLPPILKPLEARIKELELEHIDNQVKAALRERNH